MPFAQCSFRPPVPAPGPDDKVSSRSSTTGDDALGLDALGLLKEFDLPSGGIHHLTPAVAASQQSSFPAVSHTAVVARAPASSAPSSFAPPPFPAPRHQQQHHQHLEQHLQRLQQHHRQQQQHHHHHHHQQQQRRSASLEFSSPSSLSDTSRVSYPSASPHSFTAAHQTHAPSQQGQQQTQLPLLPLPPAVSGAEVHVQSLFPAAADDVTADEDMRSTLDLDAILDPRWQAAAPSSAEGTPLSAAGAQMFKFDNLEDLLGGLNDWSPSPSSDLMGMDAHAPDADAGAPMSRPRAATDGALYPLLHLSGEVQSPAGSYGGGGMSASERRRSLGKSPRNHQHRRSGKSGSRRAKSHTNPVRPTASTLANGMTASASPAKRRKSAVESPEGGCGCCAVTR